MWFSECRGHQAVFYNFKYWAVYWLILAIFRAMPIRIFHLFSANGFSKMSSLNLYSSAKSIHLILLTHLGLHTFNSSEEKWSIHFYHIKHRSRISLCDILSITAWGLLSKHGSYPQMPNQNMIYYVFILLKRLSMIN